MSQFCTLSVGMVGTFRTGTQVSTGMWLFCAAPNTGPFGDIGEIFRFWLVNA